MQKIILFLILQVSALLAQEPKAVAVLDFQASGGLQTSEVATLTGRFRSILVNTGKFTVLERDKMSDLLKQQNFNLSDNCNSAECAVQIGQLLGVEQMIAGDIGKLGATWTIDLRQIDVETGKIILTKSKDFKGEIDGMLGVMKDIANEFAGLKTEAVEPVITAKGDIYLTSSPAGAQIFIDGKMFTDDKKAALLTPRMIEGLSATKHTIELKSGEMIAKREIDLKANDLMNVELKLSLPTVTMKFISSPLGADILLDGQKIGVTPSVQEIPVGNHTAKLTLANYADYSEEITIRLGEPAKSISAQLLKNVKLTIVTDPPEARIYIDDALRASASPLTVTLPEGNHVVLIKPIKTTLEEINRAINLTIDQQLDFKLKKRKAVPDEAAALAAAQLQAQKDAERLRKRDKQSEQASSSKSGGVKWWVWALGIGGAGVAAAVILGGGGSGGGGNGSAGEGIPTPAWPN